MFHLPFHIDNFPFGIDHHKKILLLGSCFSDEIGSKFHFFGFNTYTNPFGTIFHPEPLARFIENCLNQGSSERIIQREDVFLSWDAGSTVYSTSKKVLESDLLKIREDWKTQLSDSNIIFVTFGSAWSYRLLEDDQIVANCHKFPGNQFKKELSQLDVLIIRWRQIVSLLNKVNPHLQIVFTVSPVRHSKDGLVENNQSKAILLLLADALKKEQNCHYFQSYELVIDVLRDYRFFKEDLVHPNDQAINFVWEELVKVSMNDETRKLCGQILKLRLASSHRMLHPESKASGDHLQRTEENIKNFLIEFPEVNW